VTKRYRVLIADKNPRIREFLRREFSMAGYIVRLAETGEQLLKMVYGPMPLDLLIIDPDFPDADFSVLTQKLQARVPRLPIVLHTLELDMNTTQLPLALAQWVEKNGCSVENLKKTVAGMLALQQPPSTEPGAARERHSLQEP
jgi:DNA-binding NtrC family response regulator